MSVRGTLDVSRGGSTSRGRGSYDNKFKGAIVSHPVIPVQPVNLVNRYQILGQIPRPYNTVLASKPPVIDPFANTSKPIVPFVPSNIYEKPVSEYTQSQEQNLFFIEHFMKPSNNPIKLAAQFFPPGWHFTPSAPYKSLSYYKEILFQTDSVSIKPILDRKDESKVLYHSIYIKQIISQDKWHSHPSDLQLLTNSKTHCCYYDYMEAWDYIFLYQNESFSHSWFIQFDHKFKSPIPLWFIDWWSSFGPKSTIIPDILLQQIDYFKKVRTNKNPDYSGFEILHFFSKYKVPWIFKWQYRINVLAEPTNTVHTESGHIATVTDHDGYSCVSRVHYIKWWDKFNIDRIIGQVQKEFPPILVKTKPTIQDKKLSDGSSSSLDVSSINKLSASELTTLLKAIQARTGSLKEESSGENATKSSYNSSQHSTTNPYTSAGFQDAQDPYA